MPGRLKLHGLDAGTGRHCYGSYPLAKQVQPMEADSSAPDEAAVIQTLPEEDEEVEMAPDSGKTL